ncbi:MAG: metallo-mystery pair system four-Cys motif protein [Kangiellaceae bacterium]|nr:metallo-mystery pair system four-Cys motif protein [Kangiellaceae bacterium]MCW9018222.1 metallo-mystery pair system four-Cys motif protein [Kangiellaceae bacterium]
MHCNSNLQIEGKTWQLSQFQFFVHNFYTQDKHGQWHPASISSGENQSNSVSLLGEVCGADNNWKAKLNTVIPENKIEGLKFTLGVPHQLNHLNPITQPFPLNQSDMFWTWQMGYKFARVELINESNEWIFHLGSTGCDSPSPVRAPEEACKNPNRSDIRISSFDSNKLIQISLDELLRGINLQIDNNCQSAPSELCDKLLGRMGINSKQTIFGVK